MDISFPEQQEQMNDSAEARRQGIALGNCRTHFTPFAVHLRKMYIHLRQQLKLYGKYTFISTSMKFMNANELSITLFAYVLTFNSING